MKRGTNSTLRPGGAVLWYIPGRKRPVAATTAADSFLVEALVEEGAHTFREVRDRVNFSPDVVELCDIMEAHGMIERPIQLAPDGLGIQLV